MWPGRKGQKYIQLRWGIALKQRVKEYNDGLRQTCCDNRKCLEVAQNCVQSRPLLLDALTLQVLLLVFQLRCSTLYICMCTPIPCLHTTLNITPISDFIYHLTDTFFGSCPAHPNPLIRSIGNYSLADFHRQYKKYIHRRPKHILL